MTSVFGEMGNGKVDLATHPIEAVRAVAGGPLGSKVAEVVPRTEPIRRAASAQVLSKGPTLPGLLLITDQRVLMLQESHDWSVRVGACSLSEVKEISVERVPPSAVLRIRTAGESLAVTMRDPTFAPVVRDHILRVCPAASSPDLDQLAASRPEWSIESPNLPLDLGECRYLGGIKSQPSAIGSVRTVVRAPGIEVGPIPLPWRVVFDVWVYGPDTASSRVTVPRVLLLGVFALAVPKATKQSFLVIETEHGQGVIECFSLTSAELASQIELVRQPLLARQRERDRHAATPTSAAPSHHGRDVLVDQIRQLAALRDDGLITDREFEEKKAELLRRF